MAQFDWDRYVIESRFDNRGTRLEWKKMNIRVQGAVRPGLVFNAPAWIVAQIEPELSRRRDKSVKLKREGPKWLYAYTLRDELDGDMEEFLTVLASTISIGRRPDGVTNCLALDFYKTPEDGVPPMQWPNTRAGDLVHRSKYWADPAAFAALRDELVQVIRRHPALAVATAITSIPGRDSSSAGHGERLARAVSARVNKTFEPTRGLYEIRNAAKAGGQLQPDDVQFPSSLIGADTLIIVDDVLRSGHSMGVIASKARDSHVRHTHGVVGAKTLRN